MGLYYHHTSTHIHPFTPTWAVATVEFVVMFRYWPDGLTNANLIEESALVLLVKIYLLWNIFWKHELTKTDQITKSQHISETIKYCAHTPLIHAWMKLRFTGIICTVWVYITYVACCTDPHDWSSKCHDYTIIIDRNRFYIIHPMYY